MSRCSRTRNCAFAGIGLGALVLGTPATAADMAIKAPALQSVYDWTGFYIGGHFGYGSGGLGPGTNPLPEQSGIFPSSVTGLIGGYEAGYNWQLANHSVLGVEADASFTSPVDSARLVPSAFNSTIDYVSTVRGRVGYAFGTWMPYVTGGFAWAHTHVNLNDNSGSIFATPGAIQTGWAAGAGVAFAVSGNWSAKLEYDYISLASRTYDLSSFGLPSV